MENTINTKLIVSLYQRHKEDLARVRAYQKKLFKQRGPTLLDHIIYTRGDCYAWERLPGFRLFQKVLRKAVRPFYDFQQAEQDSMSPALADLEAEITYLLLRHYKPRTVVEISPNKGWSTTWMLHALRDNGFGKIYSYDLVDWATKHVPEELYKGLDRWELIVGDVTKNLDRLPAEIDYLFMDSDHSAEFGEWYLKALLPRLRPGIPVSVHDVEVVGSDRNWKPITEKLGEGRVVLEYLKQKGIAPFAAPINNIHYDTLAAEKRRLGLADLIHPGVNASMIYWVHGNGQ